MMKNSGRNASKRFSRFMPFLLAAIILVSGCGNKPPVKTVPHVGKWGIYALDLATQNVTLIYSTNNDLFESALGLNSQGTKFVFAENFGATPFAPNYLGAEICTVGIDGENFQRLTDNSGMDLYATWSPDGNEIAFLSQRDLDTTLDIYKMDFNGNNQSKLYDSGANDGDIHWVGNKIVYTSGFKIWHLDVTDPDHPINPTLVTDPPHAGELGVANLPYGDYDPRFNSDGSKIVFERIEDVSTPNGSYNIYAVNSEGTGETQLTHNTGYAQGMASWSHSGDRVVYVVAAIDGQGKYDIYTVNSDGTNDHNITPSYFPADFLVRQTAIFSADDSKIYFIGMWWE
jgi:Tol biopolymer transport system component